MLVKVVRTFPVSWDTQPLLKLAMLIVALVVKCYTNYTAQIYLCIIAVLEQISEHFIGVKPEKSWMWHANHIKT